MKAKKLRVPTLHHPVLGFKPLAGTTATTSTSTSTTLRWGDGHVNPYFHEVGRVFTARCIRPGSCGGNRRLESIIIQGTCDPPGLGLRGPAALGRQSGRQMQNTVKLILKKLRIKKTRAGGYNNNQREYDDYLDPESCR